MKENPAALAERLFERYLDERGYEWDYEPKLGPSKTPDYLVKAGGRSLMCEVKAFASNGAFNSRIGSRSSLEVLKPYRSDIREAARQLRDFRHRAWPTVIVLSNPFGHPIPTTPKMLISAMYGDLEGSAPISADGSLGPLVFRAGRNGKLRNDHQYVSAVAMLHREPHFLSWAKQWFRDHRSDYPDERSLAMAFLAASESGPPGDDVKLDVIETVSENANQLPRNVLNGPLDRRWAWDPARTEFAEVALESPLDDQQTR